MREFEIKIKVRAPKALIEANKKSSIERAKAAGIEIELVSEDGLEHLNINGLLGSAVCALNEAVMEQNDCWFTPGESFRIDAKHGADVVSIETEIKEIGQ